MLCRAPREHLDVLWHDVVYAFRVLAKHPVASATAILSLAVGIGLNSAVYSVVSGVLWRSLPFDGSEPSRHDRNRHGFLPSTRAIVDKLLRSTSSSGHRRSTAVAGGADAQPHRRGPR